MRLESGWQQEDEGVGAGGRGDGETICEYSYHVSREFPSTPPLLYSSTPPISPTYP